MLLLIAIAALLSPAKADEWKRVSSEDGAVSALFPVDLRDNLQISVDKTAAGKVKSNFGEYYGNGILLAGSGADIPKLARMAGNKAIFGGTKKSFLEDTQGTEISFTETTVKGAPAGWLIFKGNAYRGKGAPYQARALLIIVDKRMYIINSVTTIPSPENKAAEEKLFDSIEISG